MPKRRRVAKARAKRKLYTLTEVAKETGISLPTLQRYKKAHQRRIPAVGKGRRQRYPAEALPVFKEIRAENMKRRGRPKKKAVRAKKAAVRASGRRRTTPPGLLTLSEVSERAGISYPTAIRYVKLFLDKIPHQGEGRMRRFRPAAVGVFKELRSKSRRGRKKGVRRAGPARVERMMLERIRNIERAQAATARQVKAVLETLKKPIQITVKRG